MIIKGNARRRDPRTFAEYLERSDEQSQVVDISLRGVAALDLSGAIAEMNTVASGAICKAPLYHAMISPTPGHSRIMAMADWLHSADVVEDALGLTGQPRALVIHEGVCIQNNGVIFRSHAHVVFLRVRSRTMTSVPLKFDLRVLQGVAAKLARHFGYEPVLPDPDRGPRITPAELAIAKRGGFTVRQFRNAMTSWFEKDAGQTALPMGVLLARGDKGVPVFVTEEGGVLSVGRSAYRISPTDLEARIGDVNRLPTVAQARAEQQSWHEWHTLVVDSNREEAKAKRAQRYAAAREQMVFTRAEILGSAASFTGRQIVGPPRFLEARMAVNTAIGGGDALPETVQFMWDPYLDAADPLWLHPVADLVNHLTDAGVLCTMEIVGSRLKIATCDCTDIAVMLRMDWVRSDRKASRIRYTLDRLAASVANSSSEALSSGVFRTRPYSREDGWDHNQLEAELGSFGIFRNGRPDSFMTRLVFSREAGADEQTTPLGQLTRLLRREIQSTVIEAVDTSSAIVRASMGEILDRIDWVWAVAPSKARAWLEVLRAASAQSAANEATRNATKAKERAASAAHTARIREQARARARIPDVKIISSKIVSTTIDPVAEALRRRQAAAREGYPQQARATAVPAPATTPVPIMPGVQASGEKPVTQTVQERFPNPTPSRDIANPAGAPSVLKQPSAMPIQLHIENEKSAAQYGRTLPPSAQRRAAAIGQAPTLLPTEARPVARTLVRNAPTEAPPVVVPTASASNASAPQPRPEQLVTAKAAEPAKEPQTTSSALLRPEEVVAEAKAKQEKRRRAALAEKRRNGGGFEL